MCTCSIFTCLDICICSTRNAPTRRTFPGEPSPYGPTCCSTATNPSSAITLPIYSAPTAAMVLHVLVYAATSTAYSKPCPQQPTTNPGCYMTPTRSNGTPGPVTGSTWPNLNA